MSGETGPSCVESHAPAELAAEEREKEKLCAAVYSVRVADAAPSVMSWVIGEYVVGDVVGGFSARNLAYVGIRSIIESGKA